MSEDQIILAAVVTNAANDVTQYAPMVEATLASAGISALPARGSYPSRLVSEQPVDSLR